MVSFSSSVFISRFNNAIVRRTKSFSVPVSKFSREILNLFYKEGYIFSYYFDSTKNCFLVYPNHRVVSFKLILYSKPSRKLNFKYFQVKKNINSGKFFILKTVFGLQFSDSANLNRIGGQPIFIMNYFLW
ncbi:MAG: 30S ribosomal protein S8 [Pseudomonadota bacterium]|jgi:ribosomal protein S8